MTSQTDSATEAIRITPAQKTYVHALQVRHGLETVRQAMEMLIEQDKRCEKARDYKRAANTNKLKEATWHRNTNEASPPTSD